jgi:glycosyltransferase involved in cell wall biosynthesis/SAM-dependent methyltransferase
MNENINSSQSLPWTGERFLPEMQGSIEIEHLHRYLFAGQLTTGKRVLDIASGEGYGSALLANAAISVVGVDISQEAIAHASAKYQAVNLEYKLGSCAAIPLADQSVDVVVSFETIEHHVEHEAMMREIKRVLIPGGLLIISCPDKLEYSDRTNYDNPYHVKELYRDEFESLLGAHFKNHRIAGQRIFYGSAIFGESSSNKINNYDLRDKLLEAVPGIQHAVYLIAVASDVDLPSMASGILEQSVNESDEVRACMGQITGLNQVIADRDKHIMNLDSQIINKNRHISNLNEAAAVSVGQIADLHQKLIKRNKQIADIYSSTSWRLTKPVRFVGRQINRAKRIKALVILAVKLSGGVTNIIIKALKLFRNEGISGLKRGINLVAKSGTPISKKVSDSSDRNNYDEWVRRYDTVTNEVRTVIRKRMDILPHQPLMSVVMPVYNPNPEWLIEAIDSVCNQIYQNWELCIADDASTDARIRPILEGYAKKDSRIKVNFRRQNGHICAASNSALELVTGEWVALLDHEDLLSELALFWVTDAIYHNLDVKLIYSDEDRVNVDGKRFNPHFKCDWNLDLFYSHNIVSHLGVYRADLLKAIGGFRLGFEGSQDYDLALRYIERIEPKEIHHIPRVLYHWRAHADSTAHSINTKPYDSPAGENALNEHFQRQNIQAKAELISHWYRVHYSLPDKQPLASLIIPTRNRLELLRRCVESILNKTTYTNYEILIVNNGSDDPETIEYLKGLEVNERINVIHDDRPFNYSALNNAAVKLAKGEILGLLNNDVEIISPEWLSELVSIALQPNVGAVGARLWYPNNELQHGGVILVGGVAGHAHKNLPKSQIGYMGRASIIQSFSAVTAACLVIKKMIYEEVGGLNETELTVAFNDVDFCLRVREAGYRNVWTPYAELYHYESATRGSEDTPEKQERFEKEIQYMKTRWGKLLTNDPAYSPNLTIMHEDFSYAWPPRMEILTSESIKV